MLDTLIGLIGPLWVVPALKRTAATVIATALRSLSVFQVTPDQAVQFEALLAGLGQRDTWHIGPYADTIVKQLSELPAGPATTLRLVLDMLLPDTAGRQAAAAIEQCVLVSRALLAGISAAPCVVREHQVRVDDRQG